ncbi:phosphotransferase family protein [Erythrobacter insulae]|uniref:Phosphotransferase family protein n=1 Tax=Erythrobacter insulae TaxID=2584124 RepID=A0A547PAC1_9SPHN|nr:phosphotransferase family protein [Erythrobacter insulae]TRD11091.1 phosphotransferase family protein [Erythrobacter insulae]
MGDATLDTLTKGLARAMSRAGLSPVSDLTRLTGGATMESWHFTCGEEAFVLRRAPSLKFMQDRPFGHDVEAAIIRAAHAKGVTAPEVIVELLPEDGIGSGFVMRALPGTPNPKLILEMEEPDRLLSECAANLARIHSLGREDVPAAVPVMDYRAAIADLKAQFEDAGGDRPIIALGLKWMEDNCPEPVEPVLIHGDYRMGNILVDDGWLTGVLDWELAHFGDYHEDLAFGCMAVWRFHRYDRSALGLSDLETYFDAYEANGGRKVDRARFRYWLIHRTVWWALGCLRMAQIWRSGEDRMLERVVISRRTSEQELDLLMLLEEDAPEEERARPFDPQFVFDEEPGEASGDEIALAISEWLTTIKDKLEGHDRFQLAVARNALGILQREGKSLPDIMDRRRCDAIFAGEENLATPELLRRLRQMAFDKLTVDVPRYPALKAATANWPMRHFNSEE